MPTYHILLYDDDYVTKKVVTSIQTKIGMK